MRARNIKPGFFSNDLLAECHPLARILFAGLWCMADRSGRLEDRPQRIRAELLPYDNCDVDGLLGELASKKDDDGYPGFIVRYQAEGKHYIQVLHFLEHQNPHVKEKASTIPAPDLHRTSTVQTPDEHETDPADSGFRIPDSPSLDQDQDHPQPLASDLIEPERPGQPATEYSEAFEDFWRQYPVKVDKKRAWVAWKKQLKAGFTLEQIMEALGKYIRHAERHKQKFRHPTTFLNNDPSEWVNLNEEHRSNTCSEEDFSESYKSW